MKKNGHILYASNPDGLSAMQRDTILARAKMAEAIEDCDWKAAAAMESQARIRAEDAVVEGDEFRKESIRTVLCDLILQASMDGAKMAEAILERRRGDAGWMQRQFCFTSHQHGPGRKEEFLDRMGTPETPYGAPIQPLAFLDTIAGSHGNLETLAHTIAIACVRVIEKSNSGVRGKGTVNLWDNVRVWQKIAPYVDWNARDSLGNTPIMTAITQANRTWSPRTDDDPEQRKKNNWQNTNMVAVLGLIHHLGVTIPPESLHARNHLGESAWDVIRHEIIERDRDTGTNSNKTRRSMETDGHEIIARILEAGIPEHWATLPGKTVTVAELMEGAPPPENLPAWTGIYGTIRDADSAMLKSMMLADEMGAQQPREIMERMRFDLEAAGLDLRQIHLQRRFQKSERKKQHRMPQPTRLIAHLLESDDPVTPDTAAAWALNITKWNADILRDPVHIGSNVNHMGKIRQIGESVPVNMVLGQRLARKGTDKDPGNILSRALADNRITLDPLMEDHQGRRLAHWISNGIARSEKPAQGWDWARSACPATDYFMADATGSSGISILESKIAELSKRNKKEAGQVETIRDQIISERTAMISREIKEIGKTRHAGASGSDPQHNEGLQAIQRPEHGNAGPGNGLRNTNARKGVK